MYEHVSTKLRVPIKSWLPEGELFSDVTTLQQAMNLANHPRVFSHVALMPDAHVGFGMPIGGVAALIDAISPNMVGSDIGCGMVVTQTNYPAEYLTERFLADTFTKVEEGVPAGYGKYQKRRHAWAGFSEFKDNVSGREPGWLSGSWDRAKASLGTLGGGNHFMEIQAGDDGFTYLMIHTGSRGLGAAIHKYYSKLAEDSSIFEKVPRELAFFDTSSKWGQEYIRDMMFAMAYAETNRQVIMDHFEWAFFSSIRPPRNLDITPFDVKSRVNIHHNFAAHEFHNGRNVWVHRKGATEAREEHLGIIPGSMGTPSYVVAGKGNPLSFKSCSHGAGRAMSRSAAKHDLLMYNVRKSMEGIYVHGGNLPIDEAPDAYKDITDVINNQRDLISVVRKLEPKGVYKG